MAEFGAVAEALAAAAAAAAEAAATAAALVFLFEECVFFRSFVDLRPEAFVATSVVMAETHWEQCERWWGLVVRC